MSDDTPLLTCGHYANATKDGVPACAIHGVTDVDPTPQPPRTDWTCGSCKRVSATPVAFADAKTGFHYDGCRGWN
jgi:hypothetical protein